MVKPIAEAANAEAVAGILESYLPFGDKADQTALEDLAANPVLGLTAGRVAVRDAAGNLVMPYATTPLAAPPPEGFFALVGETDGTVRVVNHLNQETILTPTFVSPYAKLTADVTFTNTTTPADVTGLAVPVEANAEYDVSLFIIYSGLTVADFKLGWSGPAGASLNWSGNVLAVAETAASGGSNYLQRGIASTLSCGTIDSTGTPQVMMGRAYGILTVGDTAGTLQVTGAQVTANATASRAIAGSRLSLLRRE